MKLPLAAVALASFTATGYADPAQAPEAPRDPDRVHLAEALALVGGASVVAGVALGFEGYREYHGAFDAGHCMTTSYGAVCDVAGQSTTERAHVLGNVGTAFGIAGVAAVGAAAITYFTAPRTGAVVAPVLGEHGGGLALSGRF